MPTRNLTVIQILPALVSGGVERGTLEIARALVAAGHRSIVISAGGPLVAQLTRDGSEHIELPIGEKSPGALWQARRLRRRLAELRADIVHARSRLPGWVAWLALRKMPATSRPRFVTTVHGLYSVNRYSAIMTRGDAVIAVSETARRYVLDNYPDCTDPRIRVVPRGVSDLEFPRDYRPGEAWTRAWYERYPQLRDRRVVTIAGRITRRKGHAIYLRLLDGLRRAGLPVQGLIVGPGARSGLQRELRRAIEQTGLADAITFAGVRDDMREVLAQSDLVVSLSELPESFGRTTLEALALGVPAIGWAHGGVAEVLAELFPAGLVTPFDETELLRRVLHVLRSGERPAPRGERYRLEHMCATTLDIYRELVAETRK